MSNNKYLEAVKAKAVFIAQMAIDVVNGSYSRKFGMAFWEVISREHRYLQNVFFWDVIMRFIYEASKVQYYDARNESMVKVCKEIAEKFPHYMPTGPFDDDKEELSNLKYMREDKTIRNAQKDAEDVLEELAKHYTFNG